MRLKTLISVFFFLCLSVCGQQEKETYQSIIRDDLGKPLSNVTVRVRGTGQSVLTNENGEFTVNASAGDVLIISKDGKRINTVRLNNSNFYKIDDESEAKTKRNNTNSKRKLSTPTNQEFEVRSLLDSAKYYQNSNPDKSIAFVEKTLKKVGKRGNVKDISNAYTILGDVYFNIKQYDLAVSNYEIALNFNKLNAIKFKLAKAYTLNSNYDESTEMYNELLKEKITTKQKIAIYEGLGDNASQKLDKLDVAIENYQKGLTIANQHQISSKVSELNSKIGETYSQKGEPEQAEEFFNNSLELSEEEDADSRARSTNSIADYYRDNQNYDKEIELRKETLKELKTTSQSKFKVDKNEKDNLITSQKINLDIGKAYANKGALKEAIPYLEESIEEANLAADLETQKDALQRLSELYRSAGNSDKALEKYQEYAQLVDVIYKQKEKEIDDAIVLGKELTNKQNRINSLEKDRELSESRYQFFNTQNNLPRKLIEGNA